MFAEIHIILVSVYLIITASIGLRIFKNKKEYQTRNDRSLFILLIVLNLPAIIDAIESFFLISQIDNSNLYFPFLIFGFLFSFVASCLLPRILNNLSNFINVQLKYKKLLLFLVIFGFSTQWVHLLFLFNSSTIIENNYAYYLIDLNLIFNSIISLCILLFSLPYLLFFYGMFKRLESRKKKRKGYLINILLLLKIVTNYFRLSFGNSWIMVILLDSLEIALISIAFYVFYENNFVDEMFLQLNFESVYIANLEGQVVYCFTSFSFSKIKKQFDDLIGGLVKGIDETMKELKSLNKVGLNKITLDDGTVMLLEKSSVTNYYYIAFVKKYNSYTREKLRELKKLIDWDLDFKDKAESDPFLVDQEIKLFFNE